MPLTQNSLIEAVDFDSLVGTSPSSTANALNTVLAVGNNAKGYGQTAVPQVSVGSLVAASDWANLASKTTLVASHQGTPIQAVSVSTSVGGKVTYDPAFATNVQNVYANRRNAAAQGTSVVHSLVNAGTWSSQITFTHTLTFESGDKARYFFNAGGQLAVTCSHPAGTRVNGVFNNIGTSLGTIVISGHDTGTATIAGGTYTGLTKVGGGATQVSLNPTLGYYGLTTTDQVAIRQNVTGRAPYTYLDSYISVSLKTNGTQGGNGDNGSVITITTIWDEVPNGIVASTGSTVNVTIRPPSTAYLTNTWGTISVTKTVSGN